MSRPWQRLVPWLLLLPLVGCGGRAAVVDQVFEERDAAPSANVNIAMITDAVPKAEPRSRYGNPSSYEVNGSRYYVMADGSDYVERGFASWYGTKFHGRRTSSGEPYDVYKMTAAHKTLPLPTYVQVTNLENGRKVIVKVNDRGPFHHNRILDLSYAAAVKLGIQQKGTGFVEVRAIDPSRPSGLAERPAPAPAPGPRTETADKPEIYLQVGAFASRDNAEQLRSRLAGAAIAGVRVMPAGDTASPIFRVRIGPLAGADEADRLVDAVMGLGLPEPHVVTD